MSNPLSSGSIAIQSQVLSSEVKMKGEEKDLIPRKCSTNLPARCRKTIGLPTGVLSPVSFSVAAPRPELFFFYFIFSLNFHNKDVSKQHFAGGPTWRASPLQPRCLPPPLPFPKERQREIRTTRVENPNSYVVGLQGREGTRGRAEAAATPAVPPQSGCEPRRRRRATPEPGELSPGAGEPARKGARSPAAWRGPAARPGRSRQSLRSSHRCCRCSRGPAAERPPPPAAAEGGRT